MAVVIAGHFQVECGIVVDGRMVEYHIEYDPDIVVVKCLDHLLEFPDPHIAIVRV